jgi:hypothetical protein
MAFDPDDCGACLQFGFDCPPPFHGFLDKMRGLIIAKREASEEDREDDHPWTFDTPYDLTSWIDSERDKVDCIALLEAFEAAGGVLSDGAAATS